MYLLHVFLTQGQICKRNRHLTFHLNSKRDYQQAKKYWMQCVSARLKTERVPAYFHANTTTSSPMANQPH